MLQLISLSAVRAEIELVRSKAGSSGGKAAAPLQSSEACETAHVAALLEWAQVVCARYGLPVRGFGDCFADGSAFCLLVRPGVVAADRCAAPAASDGSSPARWQPCICCAAGQRTAVLLLLLLLLLLLPFLCHQFLSFPVCCRCIITWATLMWR